MTKIQWTDATWNPIVGCSVVSPGCTNCYAMRMAGTRLKATKPYSGLTQDTKAGPVWTGEVRFLEDRLEQPLRWCEPRMVFVNSMSDLFHKDVPVALIAKIFGVMAVGGKPFHGPGDGAPIGGYWTNSAGSKRPYRWPNLKHGAHIFQILTKRHSRMRDVLNSPSFRHKVASEAYRFAHNRINAGGLATDVENGANWPLRNVWLGVSVEDQRRADERIPALLDTPAAIRFLSCEPLLGPVVIERWLYEAKPMNCPHCGAAHADTRWYAHRPHSLHSCQSCGQKFEGELAFGKKDYRPKLDWIIVGGESGPGARPMHPDWARSIRDQCQAAGVPFFFKQWGAWHPNDQVLSGDQDFTRMPVKRSGRLLDWREWDEFPA